MITATSCEVTHDRARGSSNRRLLCNTLSKVAPISALIFCFWIRNHLSTLLLSGRTSQGENIQLPISMLG